MGCDEQSGRARCAAEMKLDMELMSDMKIGEQSVRRVEAESLVKYPNQHYFAK
jgi:hypothetical protein